ncbi:SH3 domain-containing protein [Paenibacillus maysiensis]|uniref:SH3 domain-containing protein n=1 Tax=Paenibacillus maysiensis TaxID=1155954 RepID=UPI00047290E5|nr:SH3 domain-containing protein [Paenibacillus maysiensis]
MKKIGVGVLGVASLIMLAGCNVPSQIDININGNKEQSEPSKVQEAKNSTATSSDTQSVTGNATASKVKTATDSTTSTSEALQKKSVKSSYPVKETAIEEDTWYWRVTEAQVNLRKGPDIHSQSMAVLERDEELEYLHHKYIDPNDDRIWYEVQTWEGKIGWISSRVIIKSDGRYYSGYADTEEIEYWQVTVSQANLRAEPSISSKSVGIVHNQDYLEFLQDTVLDPSDGRTWYRVETSDGLIGWISSRVVLRG